MASVKAEKLLVMTQLFEPMKKKPAKASDGGASKSTPASKADPKRAHGDNAGAGDNNNAGATAVVGEDGDGSKIDDGKDDVNNKGQKKS
ncbi:hypothetical protein Acr_25g0005780 [Actinidia rufa]|uniref:Uncharacterized protein n=1 Tax=Actinidia rufa TaxID=165716 RepID=A0A7J0GZC5_9ERIC|nr:hypothetical protein Acr_25g0005780 [Actinidia rufa]